VTTTQSFKGRFDVLR